MFIFLSCSSPCLFKIALNLRRLSPECFPNAHKELKISVITVNRGCSSINTDLWLYLIKLQDSIFLSRKPRNKCSNIIQ